jgi:hypothetical protein
MVLPGEDEMEDDTMEIFYVDQIFKMTKAKAEYKILPKKLIDDPPDNVSKQMSDYIKGQGSNNSPVLVKITGTPSSNPNVYHHQYPTKYFVPQVVNYVGRTTDARARRQSRGGPNLEGYGVCLSNPRRKKQVQVIFDVVLISEEILDDVEDTGEFQKEKHLTPLESSLDQSISAANAVLREMKYMEKREARMRKTAESINARVRWFSYLSVSVLLSVTYIQVTYLKRYFHKKKLM